VCAPARNPVLTLIRTAGHNAEGEEASGTITIPEVAHDTEEDEYVVCSLIVRKTCGRERTF
jgi:hypothetical protein